MAYYSPVSVATRALLAEKLPPPELAVACRGLEKLGLLSDKRRYANKPKLLPCEELSTVRAMGYMTESILSFTPKTRNYDSEALLRALLAENRWKKYISEGFDPHALVSIALQHLEGRTHPGDTLARAAKAMFFIWLKLDFNFNSHSAPLIAPAICAQLFGQTWWDLRLPGPGLAQLVHEERPEFCTNVRLLEGYQAHTAVNLPSLEITHD